MLHRMRPMARIVAAFGLVVFALGSNNCMLGAWHGDVRMACLALPAAEDMGPHSCCQAPTSGAQPEPASPSGTCCIHPAPVPEALTLAGPSEASPVAPIGPVPAELSAPALDHTSAAWVPADRPPPARPTSLPLSSRAPPRMDLIA